MHQRSKVVDTQLAWGSFVREAIAEHGDEVIAILHKRFARFDAYSKNALRERYCAYYVMIAEVTRALRDAEHQCIHDYNALRASHSVRDEAMAQLETELDRVKRALKRMAFMGEHESMGQDMSQTLDPKQVLQEARALYDALKEKQCIGTFSLTPLMERLHRPMQRLSIILDDDESYGIEWIERRSVQMTWKGVLETVSSSLSAEFSLAGLHDLADAIKPTFRRLGGLEEPVYNG